MVSCGVTDAKIDLIRDILAQIKALISAIVALNFLHQVIPCQSSVVGNANVQGSVIASACGASLGGGTQLKTTFKALVALNQTIFFTAIVLKHTKLLKHMMLSRLTQLRFVLGFGVAVALLGKLSIVGTISLGGVTFDCSSSLSSCSAVTSSLHPLLPGLFPEGSQILCGEVFNSNVPNFTVVSNLQTVCNELHVPYELYIVSSSFMLASLYIMYLLHSIQQGSAFNVENDVSEIEEKDSMSQATSSDVTSADESGMRLRKVPHEDEESESDDDVMVKEQSPMELLRAAARRAADTLFKSLLTWRVVRDLSAFTKFLIAVATLVALLITGEFAQCEGVNQGDLFIRDDVMASNCGIATVKDLNTERLCCLIGIAVLTLLFLWTLYVEKATPFVGQHSPLRNVTFGAIVIFSVLTLVPLILISSRRPVLYYTSGTAVSNLGNRQQASGLSFENYWAATTNSGALVGISCNDYCNSVLPSNIPELLAIIFLSVGYVLTLLYHYHAAADKIHVKEQVRLTAGTPWDPSAQSLQEPLLTAETKTADA